MRPPNIIRPIRLEIQVPEDLWLMMHLDLFSQVEGRVPHGAYSRFINGLLKEFFDRRKQNVGTDSRTDQSDQQLANEGA